MELLLIGVIAAIGGVTMGYVGRTVIAKNQADTAESKAVRLLDDAKIKAKESLLNAKDKAVKVLEEAKKEEKERLQSIFNQEKRLENKEKEVDRKNSHLEKERKGLQQKAGEIKRIREEVNNVKQQQVERLEKIAAMKKEDAKKVLLSLAEKQSKDEMVKAMAKLENDKKNQLEEKAKDIMTAAMQKYANSHAADNTTSTVAITSDEMKGRVIGREGRNIKALERLTGAEIIVDDTPDAIVVSSFDALRREIARTALQNLIDDGRIHPTKIEEAVTKAKQDIDKKIAEAGEAAVYDVGITGLDPRLVKLLGRLRYRTSYGQNVMLHSLEVAHLSGVIAAELGLDSKLAKRAGLLHDIGKSVDHEVQGTHIDIGMNILQKFGESQEVIDAMKSHHEDYPFENNYSLIIAAADALSASRPGARKDTLENYLKRLGDLEDVAKEFEKVERAFAIQAGRELRVIVNAQKADDLEAMKLARNIAQNVEEKLNYPGEIKINVLRETQAVEYAR